MNRRKFLKQSAQGFGAGWLLYSPLAYFLSHIMNGYTYRAEAQAIGGEGAYDNSMKLINVCMNGAPSRWFWDCPLRPNGSSDGFRYNAQNDPKTSMLITRLNPALSTHEGIAGYCGEYATHQVNGVHLPYLWAGKIARPGGGSAQMDLLAKNMLMMRGLHTLDGHVNAGLPVAPPGGASLGGILAESSNKVFPAVGYRTDKRFYRSSKGIPMEYLASSRPLTKLFSPFDLLTTVLESNSSSVGDAMDVALEAMKRQAGDRHRMFPNSYIQRQNAKRLMKLDYAQLNTVYNSLVAKYQSLLSRSFGEASLRLAGADDVPLVGQDQVNPFRTEIAGTFGYYTGADITSMLTTGSNIEYLAPGFAVSEFMMTGGSMFQRDFSSFANIVLGASFRGAQNVDAAGGTTVISVDAHASGAYVQLVSFSRYFRGLSSCLYELIEQLKSRATPDGGNLFDKTVITLTSEFARDAWDDGKGADHGPAGSNYSILSGQIKNTTVVGDIKIEATQALQKRNTWGEAAGLVTLGGQKAGYGNAVSTVASLLQIPSPAPNNPPLITKGTNGEWVSTVGGPKNV